MHYVATAPQHDVTLLLQAWSDGEESALEKLAPIVYGELKRQARNYMAAERHQETLETRALVNEAYIRLVDWKNVRWQNRAHFFAASAQMMRRILVDYARARGNQKRGGGAPRVSLDDALALPEDRSSDFVALDLALQRLAELDPRKSRIVELRFFGGCTVEETAEVLKVSPLTVNRDWRLAKAWLYREISGGSSQG
jgi:RNA polymerase sigma factor (TIGR02999 family)